MKRVDVTSLIRLHYTANDFEIVTPSWPRTESWKIRGRHALPLAWKKANICVAHYLWEPRGKELEAASRS